MEFYERVSGARMHAAFYRPNEVNISSLSYYLIEDILEFTKTCFISLNEMHNILTYNKIWKQRLINIGSLSYKVCLNYGLTGVISRSTGIKRDLRLSKLETYANYYHLDFRSYTGQHGDCYDRFLIRMNEMSESLNIINQCINSLKKKKNVKKTNFNPHKILKHINPKKFNRSIWNSEYTSMEKLIGHFKYWSEGFPVRKGFTYKAVESPKGEFGVTMISDNTNKPYKCKVRSPAYHSMHVLPLLAKGYFLADLVTLIGSIDVVFGEVDR